LVGRKAGTYILREGKTQGRLIASFIDGLGLVLNLEINEAQGEYFLTGLEKMTLDALLSSHPLLKIPFDGPVPGEPVGLFDCTEVKKIEELWSVSLTLRTRANLEVAGTEGSQGSMTSKMAAVQYVQMQLNLTAIPKAKASFVRFNVALTAGRQQV
jgi:hypothetical protein